MFAFSDNTKRTRVRGNARQYVLPQYAYRPVLSDLYRAAQPYRLTEGGVLQDPAWSITPYNPKSGSTNSSTRNPTPNPSALEGIPEGSGYGNQVAPAPIPSNYSITPPTVRGPAPAPSVYAPSVYAPPNNPTAAPVRRR